MDPQDKAILVDNYKLLVKEFGRDEVICDVCFELQELKIINKSMKQDILSKPTAENKACELLRVIKRRGPSAFDALYKTSKCLKLYNVCDVLVDKNAPHEPNETELQKDLLNLDSSFEEQILQENWPSDDFLNNVSSQRLQCLKMDDNYRQALEHKIKNKDVYDMSNKPRGKPLILFDKELLLLDRKGIDNLMKHLDFDTVKVHQVTSMKDIKEKVNPESDNKDCLIIFLISSGGDGFLSKDNNIKAIISRLKDCLPGKPKLVFHLVMDRNSESGIGSNQFARQNSVVAEDHGTGASDFKIKDHGNENLEEFSESDVPLDTSQGEDQVDGGLEKLPKDGDIYYSRSTPCGGKVLKSEDREYSQFIQLIVYIFSKSAHKYSLVDMMRLVNDKVKQEIAQNMGTLSKRLFFAPGYVKN